MEGVQESTSVNISRMTRCRFWGGLIAGLLLGFEAMAAPAPLEWDAADHGGDMVASGRTVTRMPPAHTTWETARSRTAQSTGLRTVQIAIDAAGLGVMVRATNAKTSVALSLGEDGDSVGYWSVGATRTTAIGDTLALAEYGVGDVIGIQVDLD